jgi:hypothetical protein
VRQGERWVLHGRLPEGVLPAGVQAVLAARIDRLDGATKGVLRDASVLGLRVTVPGLVAVGRASGHGDEAVVRAAVAELVDRRLLEVAGGSAEDHGTYRFGHTLVRDVAYAGLAKAERARRHAAAAASAAAAQAAAPDAARAADADSAAASQAERALELAAEMGLPADDPAWAARGLAFTALSRLGARALLRDDREPAEQLLRRALELGRPAPGRGGRAVAEVAVREVRVRLAQALAALHRLDEAEAELQPALGHDDGALRASALVVARRGPAAKGRGRGRAGSARAGARGGQRGRGGPPGRRGAARARPARPLRRAAARRRGALRGGARPRPAGR